MIYLNINSDENKGRSINNHNINNLHNNISQNDNNNNNNNSNNSNNNIIIIITTTIYNLIISEISVMTSDWLN